MLSIQDTLLHESIANRGIHVLKHSPAILAFAAPTTNSYKRLVPGFEAHFTPAVEIGWRLAARFWHEGYGTEAGREVLRAAFEDFALDEVVSFTASVNRPAQRVIQRVGLRRDLGGDFAHPALPGGHRLSRHYLYRLDREGWSRRQP